MERKLPVRTICSFSIIIGALALGHVLTGCQSASASAPASQQLLGTWTIDGDAMKQSDDYKKASSQEKQMMESMLSMMKMEITFTKTEVKMEMDMMGQKQSETKPYSVKSEAGNTLVLTSKNDAGVNEDVTVIVVGDSLKLKQGEQSFEMKRK